MFSFFKKKLGLGTPTPAPSQLPATPEVTTQRPIAPPLALPPAGPAGPALRRLDEPARPAAVAPPPFQPPAAALAPPADAAEVAPARVGWMNKLRAGLRKTSGGITRVFTGAQIDDALYDDLETALLMADAGVAATEFLLDDVKRRVKQAGVTRPAAVKGLLADAISGLLRPLERALVVGEHTPTVMMVVGVNGAGKTTSIGKLTRHLADSGQKVLLAAGDTFRAAAREQLAVWAGRNNVEIVSQQGGDPSSVSFDAVAAGRARGCDVVIADTAGRLPTQLHLMEELRKIKRVIGKAQDGAPHEVLLVIDGNTGQNALAQLKAFDDALGLTGLIVTKLDGTAKGGVLCAIALWSQQQANAELRADLYSLDEEVAEGPAKVPVYFIGVGETLQDIEVFDAREFANALLG